MGKRKHVVNLMFTITLLGVFALAALFVAVMGAQVYSHNAEKMQANFDTRTSVIYMAEKIRQTPGGNFEKKDIDGNDALVLIEDIDGNKFESWIYVHDNTLFEVMINQGASIRPGEGQAIMSLNSMTIEEKDDLFNIMVENSQGTKESLSIGRRGNTNESI